MTWPSPIACSLSASTLPRRRAKRSLLLSGGVLARGSLIAWSRIDGVADAARYGARPMAMPGRSRLAFMRVGVGAVFEQVAGLALQHFANALQRLEAHPAHLARLQQRQVLLGDADAFGELARAHLAARQHDIQVDDDGHQTKPAFSCSSRLASAIAQAIAINSAPNSSAR